ncbi:MAG: hypothetical protein ACREDM_03295 [Methylocella sp.]
MYFAGFGLEFAWVCKPGVRPHRKKNNVNPHLGDARRPFLRHYAGAIGQYNQSQLISTRGAACRKFLAAVATGGFEVLENYALNSIELTKQFLRFPRVRQQTRGNFSFQYL